MRGANMSVVGCTVVKRFATRTTSERALGDIFCVCLEMAIKDRLVSKPFVAARTFVGFLPSVDALMSLQIIETSKRFPAGVAMMFLARLFRWRLTIARLNTLQLIIIR